MKKVLIASGAAVLAFAMIASAQGYTFSNNLTVGSTGQDVVNLQTWLITNGFSIPAVQSGAAAKGYFGSQTKAAVVAYQASVGLPNTGYVGPLTRAKLNAGGTAVTGTGATTSACPVGYTCTPIATAPIVCPAGVTCTPINGTGTVTGTTAGISTPGVAGTLAVSLWSTPSGVTVYKGQAYDIAAYKLQAGASDMAVSNFSLDFDTRLWLYANSITVKDETGAVVGTLSNLSQSNFVELTVGSDYRVSIPLNNLVVKATQSKYLTVNVAFNAVSDRSTGTLNILTAQVRGVDGTGVTDTETVTSGRSFSYNGSTTGQIYVTTDSNQPPTGLVQLSTAVQTQNVLLGVFDIKSANEPSQLQSLAIQINTNGTSVSSLFNNISIKVLGQTYSASTICTASTQTGCSAYANASVSSSTVLFTNLQGVTLPADTYTPVSVYVTVAPDTSGNLNGAAASTTLVASGTAGGSTNNPSVVDATFNNLVVTAATITNNDQTFVDAGVTIPNLSLTYGTKTCDQTNTTCNQTFEMLYALTAGNNAIYVSTNPNVAVSSSTSGSLTYTQKNFTDSNTNGDTSSYFYIAPGQSKTFMLDQYAAGPAAGGTVGVTSLNYGTVAAGPYTTALANSTLTNILKAVLFH